MASAQPIHAESTAAPLVLVIDDDDAVREALLVLLRTLGYSSVGARNGDEALDVLRGGPEPCLILLDLWMPVKTGWGFRIEQMRDARLARIPTVVLSADDARRDMTGVAATLPKPLDFERLFEIVRLHCTRPAAARPTNGDAPGAQAPVFDWLPTWVFDEIVRLARDVGTTVVGLEARCDELIFTLSTGATVRRVLATPAASHEPTAHVG